MLCTGIFSFSQGVFSRSYKYMKVFFIFLVFLITLQLHLNTGEVPCLVQYIYIQKRWVKRQRSHLRRRKSQTLRKDYSISLSMYLGSCVTQWLRVAIKTGFMSHWVHRVFCGVVQRQHISEPRPCPCETQEKR